MDKKLIELLRDRCGLPPDTVGMQGNDVTDSLCAFAALVAEECAKIADYWEEREDANTVDGHPGPCDSIAVDIREKFKP
jgi:hypothetical protein